LAAGLGTRLRPLTEDWPKCLMPIHGRPLLEFWLGILWRQGGGQVLVNMHYHADIVGEFLHRTQFQGWVEPIYEEKLLGTAGTLRKNAGYFDREPVLVVHADNWSCCDFPAFIAYHQMKRPRGTLITMMTFESPAPESCGIVELNDEGVVIGFHEKVKNPPSNLANAAVYIIEPEVLSWMKEREEVVDLSTDVLPHFIGKIATWKNEMVHKDIGTVRMLVSAQCDTCTLPPWSGEDEWQKEFAHNPIHVMLSSLESEYHG